MNKLMRVYSFFKQLPKNMHSLNIGLENVTKSLEVTSQKLEHTIKNINETLEEYGEHLEKIEANQADFRHDISALEARPKSAKQSPNTIRTPGLQADNHSLDGYYVAFEDKFRGTEGVIYERLKESYSNFLKKDVSTAVKKLPIIDIGCGRGELLQLYKEFGYQAIGVDLNETMVQKCIKNGYKAQQINAIDYLKNQPTSSLGGISGIHIAEHIPFEELIELLREAFRTVVKGGFILLETPNPENLTVGALNFWYDSSHLKPLPPDVLAFMCEYVGFGKLQIMRMQPEKNNLESIKNTLSKEMAIKLYGPRDYAIIGRKFESRSSHIK